VAQVALAAISVLICYADRSNISTAIISMAEQYQWDSGTQGIILSAFFAGYVCTQLVGGGCQGHASCRCGDAAGNLELRGTASIVQRQGSSIVPDLFQPCGVCYAR
jgi:hypothetical protein